MKPSAAENVYRKLSNAESLNKKEVRIEAQNANVSKADKTIVEVKKMHNLHDKDSTAPASGEEDTPASSSAENGFLNCC